MDYDIRDTGPGPIVSALCRELGVLETINRTVDWDEKQCNLDPGTHIIAMIINILGGRTPLYRVEKFFAEQDIELLFGKGIHSSQFNDDALSRTLDKIYAAGPKKVFSAVALQALLKEEIVLGTLHADTTSRLVYGAYLEKEGLNITRGYNKEHRSDLKQFRVGLVTTDEGYPFLGEILDGNLDDKTWNKQLLENLPEHFTAEKLKELTYVADSAVITKTNLNLMDDLKLNFISRLPDRFDLVETLVRKAFSEGAWVEVGTLAPGKNKASYRLQEFTDNLFERPYRFVVVHSSQLDKRKLKSLESRVAQEKEELMQDLKTLTRITFACEADARDALLRFVKEKESAFYPLSGTVQKELVREKRNKRGRPGKNESFEYQEAYRLNIEIGDLSQEALKLEQERLSCFVLITNQLNGSARNVLQEYKEQSVVENRFKFVKHPIFVGPLYVQKKERLEALCYVILMALAVYIILQRRVRRALKNETDPLELDGRKKSFEPTGNKILELFSPIKILWLKEGDTLKRHLPDRYNSLSRAIRLIGFTMDIFTTPP